MEEMKPGIIEPKFFKQVRTAGDWKEIQKVLSCVHPIRFVIDGYNVRMHMIEMTMKLVVILLIDEKYDILSWEKDDTEIPGKFYNKKEYYRYPKKSRDKAIYWYGKKRAKEKGYLDKDSRMQYYWTSFRSLRLHLQKTCKKIMVNKADLLKTIGDLFIEYRSKKKIED